MAECIYNIFLFFENDICSTVGYVAHDYSGSDADGIELLRARVSEDFPNATRLGLENPFTRFEYHAKCRLGEAHHLYDELFVIVGGGVSPLFVATPVKDGEVFFNYSSKHDEGLDINDIAAKLGAKGIMVDWLVKYTDDNGNINTSQLIHDDYFTAIKLTFNASLYVSAMKLLVSCIDSLAYVEYGHVRDFVPFIKWLDAYASLATLGITAAELWELRNGILHMTNINSAKVRNKMVRRISFRVGGPPDFLRDGADGIYYFDLYGLILELGEAIGRWLETYNRDRDKFAKFVERYDETISDSRVAITHLGAVPGV
jgi:hypothetical protein